MEGAVANYFFVLCIILAISNPTADAGPMTSNHNSLISTVSEALNEAVKTTVAEAKRNIKTDLKASLAHLLRQKISRFKTYGEISFDQSYIELNVHPSAILDLFKLLPLNPPISLPTISLKRVEYTFDTTDLVVTVRSYGSQIIIPNVLDLQNVAFSFSVELQDVSTLVVTFNGDVVLGGTTIPVKAIYTHASRDISITAAVSALTINYQSLATQIVGLNLPSSLSRPITLPSLTISGKLKLSGESELIVSSTGGNIHVYIIYKKTDKSRKAIAVEMSNIRLESILNDVAGLDISGIPYFGSAVIPTIALTYATHSIDDLPYDIFVSSPLLSTIGNRVEKNLAALINFEFSIDPIILHYNGGVPTFKSVTSGSLDVKSLISAIPNFDLNSIPLPPGVSGVFHLSINTFILDIKTKSIEIVVSYPGSLTFFNGLVNVDNPYVNIKGPTGGIKINIDGQLSISRKNFDVSIKRDEHSGNYILRARANKLPIVKIVSQLKAKAFPSKLNSLSKSLPFFNFSIKHPSLSLPLSSSPLQIQLTGTPVIKGYNRVHMASVIIRQGRKTLLVQGFEFKTLNLATFLKRITRFNFNNIAILNLDMKAAIVISPVSLPNIHLTGEKLSTFSITRGLSVQASMQFPSGCSSDAFCAVAQFLLGADAQLNFKGTISSVTAFTIFAGVSNINLGRGIFMSKAGLEIQGGTKNSVRIVGAVDLSNPDITLAARVFLSTSGVVLEMTMSGCWENAFGASWLDICSLQSSVAMIPGVTLTGLALGGDVHIGDESCGTPLVATGFVGIDVLTPTNNYYYVNIQGSTTVATILSAFCININVPAPLAQSGFPRGFISSFSVVGVELPHVPLSIPQGFRLNGTLNILGLEASADVTIGLPNGIDFAIALPPINVGDLLRMSVSSSDQSRGPFLKAAITLLPTPNVNIKAKGYVSVLGISMKTSLTITNTQYIFNIQGKMLNLFDANLHISAAYGNIEKAHFQVKGSFTNNLYGVLEERIKKSLNAGGKLASSALGSAQKELTRVRGVFNDAKSALQAGHDKVNGAQRKFDTAIAEVQKLRKKVDSVCSTKSCGSVCIGCPDGFTCCGKVFGKCVCKRPKWNSCCTRASDPACKAANAACVALKKPIKAALKGAEVTVNTARRTLDAAKAALTPLKAAVSAAQLALKGAEEALKGIQSTFAVGLKAANAIASFGLNGLISIRDISFSANLNVAAGGSFSGSVRAVFVGAAEATVSININLHDITSMAKQLADHIGSKFSSLF